MISYQGLAKLIGMKQNYDFIYIDGNHTAYDTLSDACMAWGLLRSGGVMLFDDYKWNKYPEPQLNPKIGIDAFLNSFEGRYDIIVNNYQLAVKKK
jgi:predicted O-methyltransferase YrrM